MIRLRPVFTSGSRYHEVWKIDDKVLDQFREEIDEIVSCNEYLRGLNNRRFADVLALAHHWAEATLDETDSTIFRHYGKQSDPDVVMVQYRRGTDRMLNMVRINDAWLKAGLNVDHN